MFKYYLLVLHLFVVFNYCHSSVFLEETFKDDGWKDSWISSKHPGKEFGQFVLSAGSFYNDSELDKGIQTSQDAKFYGVSRMFPPFSNEDKSLIIQFSVKHEQNIDCGGAYVKLFDCSLDQKNMHGESPYEIMFGPDICGGIKKVHVIFNYKGKNHLIKKDVRCKDDVYTHFYTLVTHSNNTYEVLIDNEKVESGKLEDDWDFLPPKKIQDPNAKRPTDWDDRPTIADPNDKKPENWDTPAHIPDLDATKPEDWDDEMDGEWEPPMVDNPEHKGEWQPKQLDNPNYKGSWKHPEIDNPDYTPDSNLYLHREICAIGFELWQVKSGTIFDNILITDDTQLASGRVKNLQEIERKMKTAEEQKKKDEEDNKKTDEDDDDNDEISHEEDTLNEHDEL